jgi:putative ABC transport system permease protein
MDVYVSWRSVLRQGRRSLVSAIAVISGTVALVLAAGFIEWTYWAMREGAIKSGLGHIQVVRAGYPENGMADPFNYVLPSASPLKDLVAGLPHVLKVAPRLTFSGLAGLGDSSLSFIASGIDVALEGGLDNISGVEAGELLSASDHNHVLLGRGLANNLGAKPGDKLVLLVNRRGGTLNGAEVLVKGVFFTVTKAYDDVALHVPFALAEELLGAGGAHTWVVHLDDTARTRSVARAIEDRATADFRVIPWYEAADFYNKTVRLFSKQVFVMKVIIALVVILSISNTMMMSVTERTTEIATAMAVGLRRARVLIRFLIEGLLIGLAGGALGVALGYALAAAISHVGIPMPPPPGMSKGFLGEILVTPGLALDALILAAATALLASVYPAWRASRTVIADALRHGR